MRVVELVVSGTLLWAPPAGTTLEGPAPSDEAPARDVDSVVDAAAQAAKDRAWLERNHRDIEEYVRHLDALADVGSELDACGGAIQAELRMALALAYLKVVGTCSEAGDTLDEPTESSASADLPMPVLECIEATGPSECADRLLDRVAEFAGRGPGGTGAPFSQAFGCPHAVAEMSVEQMFGSCMVGEYDEAIDRWDSSPHGHDEGDETKVWPVPRWAGIVGVSLGGALIIGGAVALGIDGKCPGGYDPVTEVGSCPSIYNTDVAGTVMVSLGALVVVGMGTVLTVTEIQRRKQGKTRPSALRRGLDRAQAFTGLRLSLGQGQASIGSAGPSQGSKPAGPQLSPTW